MNYAEIIGKAFKATWQNKYLWLLGMLAVLTEGGMNFGGSPFNLFQYNQGGSDPTPNLPSGSINESLRVLGAESNSFSAWISSHIWFSVLLTLLLFLFFIFILVVSTMAKAGLIAAILQIEREGKSGFKKAFSAGAHAFWRFLGLFVLLGLLALILISICVGPIIIFIAIKAYIAALAFGLLFVPIAILVGIYLGIISMYAKRFIVCKNVGAIGSIKKAHELIMRFKKETFLIWLIAIGLGLGIGFIIFLAMLIILMILGVPAVGISVLLYKTTAVGAALVLGILAFCVFALVVWIISGFINAFMSSYWTLAYLALTNKKE